MDKMIEHIKLNGSDFLNFDKNVIYEIVEMTQMCVIVVILMIFLMRFTTNLYLKIYGKTFKEYETYIRKASLGKVISQLIMEFSINTLLFYFVQKFIKVIPPVTYLFDRQTVPYETLSNVINIVMLVMFVELSPTVKVKLDILLKNISNQKDFI